MPNKINFNMPVHTLNQAYPEGPYRFIDREFLIISYQTDEAKLLPLLPAGCELVEPVVHYEFIRMPDSTGFGDYTESGQVVPVRFNGEQGLFTLSMYLDCHAPIAAGREIWGFPKKLAQPKLTVESDVLIGTLDYDKIRIATATMGYKYQSLNHAAVLPTMKQPIFLLKTIPDVTGQPALCQLTRTYLTDIVIKGAWSGPASLALQPHALAPIAELPVQKVLGAKHLIVDLTLPYGTVVKDYLV